MARITVEDCLEQVPNRFTLILLAAERSKQILEDNMDKLHLMSEALMKYETIDRKQIDEVMQGREPGPPQSWDDDSDTPSSGGGNAPTTGDTPDNASAGDEGSDKGVPRPAHNRQS